MSLFREYISIYVRVFAISFLLIEGTSLFAQSNDVSQKKEGATVVDSLKLDEVVVTSREGKRVTSSSLIDRKAIEHLQPSTFADLLALLPGGSTSLPDLTNANTIHLRQAGTGNSNYDISSLGTVFVTDGIPMSQNANMQMIKQASTSSYGDPDAGRNHTSAGVDMRQIPTDNIESVEIIRGIAPVEYGDLTSGLVLIQRKLRATPFEARVKTDSYSKLIYFGKGFEFDRLTTVFGLDYLDAKADPRNSLNNYKRLTASVRTQYRWTTNRLAYRWKTNLDYTGSFDNEKHDAELLKQKDDKYHSQYNRIAFSNSLLVTPTRELLLKSINFDFSLNYERDVIRQDKSINLSRDVAVSTVLNEGEHDGLYLPYRYLANVKVDGRPLNIYAKLKSLFEATTWDIHHTITAGTEWKMEKNYGHGQIYDAERPITPGTPYRPRDYKAIPAGHQLSLFAQNDMSRQIGDHQIRLSAGVRITGLANLDSKYSLSGKPFVDPRLNLQWKLPVISVGEKRLDISLNGGWGRQTKFPTLMQIYPDLVYYDFIELNYYNFNPDYRRLVLKTYKLDVTNFAISPARNDKWEVRLGGSMDGYNLSVTYFQENLSTGFRSSSTARPFSYRDYDETAIDGATLTAPPSLDDIPYTEKKVLDTYSRTTNGSRLIKEGIEYQLSTKRLKAISTRFTINGAWFRTTYTNSEPSFRQNTTAIVNGIPVNQLYIGLYDNSSGSIREQLNTNVMADTYIKKLGLAFSFTAEMTWFYSTRTMRENGVPTAYMAIDGNVYPYTEAESNDPYLQWLINKYNDAQFVKQKTPFWAYLNMKVTKDFGKFMKIALFINRMIDYMPNYKSPTGLTIRRTSKPYFGIEMNISI